MRRKILTAASVLLAVLGAAPPAGASESLSGGTPTVQTAAADPATFAYRPVTPQRLVDTRLGDGPLIGGVALDVTVPTTADGDRVLVNLTTVESRAEGYLYSGDAGVSVLNTYPGRIVPRSTLLTVSGGKIHLTSTTTTHLVVDLLGVFSSAGGPVRAGRLERVQSSRLLDSRETYPGAPPAWTSYDLVAPPKASALVLNVTVTGGTVAGFVSPDRGSTSLLNSSHGGDTATNFSVVPVNAGKVTLTVSNDAHLVVDLLGTISDPTSRLGEEGLMVDTAPWRAFDTRDRRYPAGPAEPVSFSLAARPGYHALVGVTAVNQEADGFVTVAGRESPLGRSSNLNPRPGIGAVGNLAVVSTVGGTRALAAVPTDLIIDVFGYFIDRDPGFRLLYRTSNDNFAAFTCGPLRYQVNLSEAPATARRDLNNILATLTSVAGFEFIEIPGDPADFTGGPRYPADLKITVAPRARLAEFLSPGQLGAGSGLAFFGERPAIANGHVLAVAGEDDAHLYRTLLRQVGLVLGLGYINDPEQVMYDRGPLINGLGSGDIRGLRLLRSHACTNSLR